MNNVKLDNVIDVYPLAPIQQGMLFHAIEEPTSGVFVSQLCCTLDGEFDPVALQAAWAEITQRQSVLRTLFAWDGIDEPLQIVREHVQVPWRVEDWRDLDRADQQRHMSRWMDDERRQGFDLTVAPLIRMRLARLDARSWRWLWTFHHMILDGWSTPILSREVPLVYRALTRGDAAELSPAFDYRDYISWHLAHAEEAPEAFWRNELRGFIDPTPLNLPGCRPVDTPAATRPFRRQW